jgi:transcriptional regulator with XRE-family HTH domain
MRDNRKMSECSAAVQADRELIAANIRAYRARRAMSQREVADAMRAAGHYKWRYQTMSVIERGERRVTADEILGLARVLDTFPVHLISEPR